MGAYCAVHRECFETTDIGCGESRFSHDEATDSAVEPSIMGAPVPLDLNKRIVAVKARSMPAESAKAPKMQSMDRGLDSINGRKRQDNMVASGGSSTWGEPLDERAVLRLTNWILYCCCCGIGTSDTMRPLRLQCQSCCCSLLTDGVPVHRFDGVVSCIQTFGPCTCLAKVPRLDHPYCMLCSNEFCSARHHGVNVSNKRSNSDVVGAGGEGWTEGWNEYDRNLDHCVLCYVLFCGAVAAPTCDPCTKLYYKIGCVMCRSEVVPPDLHGCCVCNYHCLCLAAQCRLPPSIADNPCCACCGYRYRPLDGRSAVPKNALGI